MEKEEKKEEEEDDEKKKKSEWKKNRLHVITRCNGKETVGIHYRSI